MPVRAKIDPSNRPVAGQRPPISALPGTRSLGLSDVANPEIGATLTSADSVETSGAPESGSRSYTVRPAAGIYGLIVSASVIAVAGTHMQTLPLAVAVVGTLIVYWVAEEYAALVEHAGSGHMPTWTHIRGAMRAKWPLVSASYIPLVTLLVARLLHAPPSIAAYIALFVIVALLMVYGWRAGRSSGLRGFPQVVMTLAAGGLGALMIFLKIGLTHLH